MRPGSVENSGREAASAWGVPLHIETVAARISSVPRLGGGVGMGMPAVGIVERRFDRGGSQSLRAAQR